MVAKRVRDARRRQMERAGICNAFLDGDLLQSCCVVTDSVLKILEQATDRFSMSVRAQRRVLRVARTIADMAGSNVIGDEYIAEALALRGLS